MGVLAGYPWWLAGGGVGADIPPGGSYPGVPGQGGQAPPGVAGAPPAPPGAEANISALPGFMPGAGGSGVQTGSVASPAQPPVNVAGIGPTDAGGGQFYSPPTTPGQSIKSGIIGTPGLPGWQPPSGSSSVPPGVGIGPTDQGGGFYNGGPGGKPTGAGGKPTGGLPPTINGPTGLPPGVGYPNSPAPTGMPNQNGMGPSQTYDPAGGMGWGGAVTSGFGPTISTGGGGFGGLGGYPGFGGFGGFGGYGGMGGASNAVKGLPADYGSSTAGGAAAAGAVTGRTARPAPASPGAGGGQSSGYPAPPDFSGGGMGFNPYGPSGGSNSAGGGAGGLPTMNIPGVGNVPVMSAGPATLTGPTAFPGTPGATPQSAGATPGAGAGAAGAAGGAGGLVGDLAGSYQNALNQSNQANAAQLGQVLGGFGGLQNNMLGVLGQTTNQQFQNVENQRQKDQAAATQNLIDRGLGNTTVGSSVSRGIQQDYQQNKNAITDQRLQQVLGILNQQGTGALNALYGFNQAGPDFNSLAALSQGIGASGQNPASAPAGGGSAGGGYQAPDLSGAYSSLGNMLGGGGGSGGGLGGFLTGNAATVPPAQQALPSPQQGLAANSRGFSSMPVVTPTPSKPGLSGAGQFSPGPVSAGPASSGGGGGGAMGSPVPNSYATFGNNGGTNWWDNNPQGVTSSQFFQGSQPALSPELQQMRDAALADAESSNAGWAAKTRDAVSAAGGSVQNGNITFPTLTPEGLPAAQTGFVDPRGTYVNQGVGMGGYWSNDINPSTGQAYGSSWSSPPAAGSAAAPAGAGQDANSYLDYLKMLGMAG